MSSAARRDRKPDPIQPSRRLIFDAVRRRRQSVMHSRITGKSSEEFTVGPGMDWAICAPLPDEPSPGWALYLTGSKPAAIAQAPGFADEGSHKSDLKFAELVADLFGSLRQVRDLQRRQTTLASFLSQPVRAALAERDTAEVLRPRETEVTVLFCDLRGSCQIAEDSEGDLMQTCARLSEALGIMTTNIIDQNGVIGDFQGDAAMGFWGWPLDDEDQIEQAARAALAIRRDFARVAQKKDHPLAGFACGIGIANGFLRSRRPAPGHARPVQGGRVRPDREPGGPPRIDDQAFPRADPGGRTRMAGRRRRAAATAARACCCRAGDRCSRLGCTKRCW